MNLIKSLCLFVLLITTTLSAKAQDQSIIIKSSNDTLLLGNYLILTVTYNNIEADIEPLSFENFNIISHPSINNQYQNINGEVTQSKSYSVHLEAIEEGSFIIPAVQLQAEKKPIVSNDLQIVVLANPDGIITTSKENPNTFFFDWSPDHKSQRPDVLAPPSKTDRFRKKRKKI